MQHRSPPARRNHLQRTAGPYIRVICVDFGMSESCPLRAVISETAVVLASLGPWLTATTGKLDQQQLLALHTCLEAPGVDVRVVVPARRRAIVLECSNAGQGLKLHREQVEALRPVDNAFGQLDLSSSRH